MSGGAFSPVLFGEKPGSLPNSCRADCMLGMNALLGYPFSLRELMEIGAKVGANVPFSLMMDKFREDSENRVD